MYKLMSGCGKSVLLNELLIKFTILHGQLMDVINSAKNPEGHKGEQISAVEKKEIFDAFEAFLDF